MKRVTQRILGFVMVILITTGFVADFNTIKGSETLTQLKVPKVKTKSSTENTITIKWKKVSGASGYNLYKYDSASREYIICKTTDKTSCKLKKLKSGKTYKFRLAAYVEINDAKIEGKRSKVFKIKTKKSKKVAVLTTRSDCTHEIDKLVKMEAVKQTCTVPGNKAYWTCTECGRYFEDKDGVKGAEIIENSWIIPEDGHNFGVPRYEWSSNGKSCKATISCKREGCTYQETENGLVTSVIKTEATTKAKGWTRYIATFYNKLFVTQTKELEDIPKLTPSGNGESNHSDESGQSSESTLDGNYNLSENNSKSNGNTADGNSNNALNTSEPTICDNEYASLNDNDIEIIRKRILKEILESGVRYRVMNLNEKPLKCEDGYFLPSIDYSKSQASEWPAIGHLEYMLQSLKSKEFGDDTRDVIIGMLDYWLANDFKNESNWYSNEIAVPLDMIEIALLLQDELNETQITKITEIVDRGSFGKDVETSEIAANSNYTYYVAISIKNAVLNNDNESLAACTKIIDSLIDYGSELNTGIQKDLSYFDYKALASGAVYSATYSSNICYLFSLLYGTKYQVSKEKEKFFIDFILDGMRYFNRKNGVPHFSLARSAVYASGGTAFKDIVEKLLELDVVYRKDDLKHYYNSFFEDDFPDEIKGFKCPGVLVSNYKSGYIAVRGCKEGYSLTDVQNKQGVLNYNLSYGSNTCYMYSGNEYSSISEVFDFSMFPGTTSYYETDAELFERWEKEYNQTWGSRYFVSAPESNCAMEWSNEKSTGVLATELHNDGIDGRNIFIIHNEVMYVLGTGFSAENPNEKPIITTIDQCKAEDNSEERELVYNNGESVSNGNFIYTNLSDAPMMAGSRMQSGSLGRTNLYDTSDVKTAKVFICYFDWGCNLKDVSYAYKVTPSSNDYLGMSSEGMLNYEIQEKEILCITNNDCCQIIEFSDGVIAGIAYQEMDYQTNNGNRLKLHTNQIFIEK